MTKMRFFLALNLSGGLNFIVPEKIVGMSDISARVRERSRADTKTFGKSKTKFFFAPCLNLLISVLSINDYNCNKYCYNSSIFNWFCIYIILLFLVWCCVAYQVIL